MSLKGLGLGLNNFLLKTSKIKSIISVRLQLDFKILGCRYGCFYKEYNKCKVFACFFENTNMYCFFSIVSQAAPEFLFQLFFFGIG